MAFIIARASPSVSTPTISVASAGPTSALITIVTASTEPNNGILGYDIEQASAVIGPFTVVAAAVPESSFPYTVDFLNDGVVYFRAKGVDAGPNREHSAPSGVVSLVVGGGSGTWIAPTPSYISQIPNAAGFGLDSVFGSGRHLSTPATTVYLVNTLDPTKASPPAPVQIATRTYTCNMHAALAAAGPKVIIPIISGTWEVAATYANQNQQYVTIAGQVAPSPGFVGINGQISMNGSDNLIWHYHNYLNPATYVGLDDKADSISIGGFNLNSGSRAALANCSLYTAFDETIQMYGIGSDLTVWQCHVGNPIAVTGRDRTIPHGTGMIVGDDESNVSILRSIMQHCNFRMPFSRGRSVTVDNCLMYNSGPTPGTNATKFGVWTALNSSGAGGQSLQSPGTVFVSFHNFEENLYVMGPSPAVGQVSSTPFWLNNGSGGGIFPAGSQLYLKGNRTRDRNSAQGQGTQLFGSGNTSEPQTLLVSEYAALPANFYATSRITAAHPPGYNVNIITDTELGKLAFATLLSNTVGARPLDRAGWDTFSPYQCKNYISGLTGNQNVGVILDGSGAVTPTSAYGGFPVLATNLVDPFSAAAMQNDPLITVENGRDVIQASGLTWLEEWLKRWHFRRATY